VVVKDIMSRVSLLLPDVCSDKDEEEKRNERGVFSDSRINYGER